MSLLVVYRFHEPLVRINYRMYKYETGNKMAETRVPSVLWNVSQTLEKTEKETARANIGAIGGVRVHDTGGTTDLVPDAEGKVTVDLGLKADKATNLTGATQCKITYNSQGIVTAGTDLSASDIPSLAASKITSGTFGTSFIADDAITAAKVKDNETLPVNISGTATKATQDSDGYNIKANYMRTSSGNKSLSYGGTTTIGTVNGNNVNLVMPAAPAAPAANEDVFEVNANVTSFSDALSAYNDGKKKLVLIAGRPGPSSFLTRYEIPLYRVVLNGTTITQFVWIASDDAYNAASGSNSFGSIMYYKLSSSGWDIGSDNIDFAKVAQVAVTAGSASTAGSATNATNDSLGSAITGTYICNAKLVYGGGGTLYPGSSFTVLSDAAIKSDDATIENRKYVELKYMSYGLGVGTRIQQVGEPYMTYNDPDTYLELSKTAYSIAGRKSQNGYFNALTSQLMGTYRNLIEVDFDYDIVATNSTASIGVAFCLASTLMEGTPQTSIATNDGRIFAFATVSGQGVGGHLRGHLHITGYLQSSHVLTGYGLCIGARSIYGDYSGTCTLKITNVNIKDSYATYT